MKKKNIILSILITIFLIYIMIFMYINNYYHAINIDRYLKSDNIVTVKKHKYGLSFKKKENKDAFIFYPGAKVEYTAYSKLMYELASNGIDCYLIKMPANLAIFGINKADNILTSTRYGKYYIGGHSLGGAMAANYAYDNQNKITGLVLLGSYSTKDISKTNIKVLSIYGSNDLILNKKNYNKNKINLPSNYKEKIINGGNHSSYASYGKQKNDGKLSISKNEQITLTIKEIKRLIKQ